MIIQFSLIIHFSQSLPKCEVPMLFSYSFPIIVSHCSLLVIMSRVCSPMAWLFLISYHSSSFLITLQHNPDVRYLHLILPHFLPFCLSSGDFPSWKFAVFSLIHYNYYSLYLSPLIMTQVFVPSPYSSLFPIILSHHSTLFIVTKTLYSPSFPIILSLLITH